MIPRKKQFRFFLLVSGFRLKNSFWHHRQGCELIGRPEKVSIGDQLETTFEVKWRPFGYHFEDGWRPIIELSVVSSNIGSNNFGLRKMALLFLNLASLSLIFNLYKVYKNQNYNLSNIKEYSIIVCWKAEFCSFPYEMLRISKGILNILPCLGSKKKILSAQPKTPWNQFS